MARRSGGKARTKTVPARTASLRANAPKAGASPQQRLAALEGERDALRGELRLALSRVRQLEETQAQVRDRISWALDSLRNILDSKG